MSISWRSNISVAVLAAMFYGLFSPSLVLAHGGEDHGEAKPKTSVGEKGTVTRTSRLGDLELTLKHPTLEPDKGTAARIFVTRYQTNEPAGDATPGLEFESPTGAIISATVEKSDQVGVFNINIPALPEGTYVARAKLTYSGETDTATFSGVEVGGSQPAAETTSNFLTSLLVVLMMIGIAGALGGLIYFALRGRDSDIGSREAVSA